MMEGIAIGAALVFNTVVTPDVGDCIQVCDWSHLATLCAS